MWDGVFRIWDGVFRILGGVFHIWDGVFRILDGVFRILDGVFDVWVVVFCIAVGRSHQWSGLLHIIMSSAFHICVLARTIFSETFVAFRVSVNHFCMCVRRKIARESTLVTFVCSTALAFVLSGR